jgi:SAM-dependent methyltransferase
VPATFPRKHLQKRYDVSAITDDEWHTYSARKSSEYLVKYLSHAESGSQWLLNAGSGIYELKLDGWREIAVDLFTSPIRRHPFAVCGSVENLPLQANSCGAIVCIGEVLAYCDPALALAEFGRALKPSGILICDFGSSRSLRYWFRKDYGRAANLVTDYYNGSPETIWVYDPGYIIPLLTSVGFVIRAIFGSHTWSALARRLGASISTAMRLQHQLEWFQLPTAWADITTIVAERAENVK